MPDIEPLYSGDETIRASFARGRRLSSSAPFGMPPAISASLRGRIMSAVSRSPRRPADGAERRSHKEVSSGLRLILDFFDEQPSWTTGFVVLQDVPGATAEQSEPEWRQHGHALRILSNGIGKDERQ